MPSEICKRIDLTGKRCILITAALAEAFELLPLGATIEAFSDDPVAHILVKRWCKDTGNKLVAAEKQNGGWRLIIQKGNSV